MAASGKQMPFYVIVVSFRAGEKLSATVNNILSQSHAALHVIVQDAESDDGSVEALKEQFGSDERLCIRREKDNGIYDAMNRALGALPDVQTGEACVLFLNCGDFFYDTDTLKKAAARIRQVQRRLAVRAQTAPEAFLPLLYYGDTFDRTAGEVVTASPRMDDFACYRHLPCHQSCIYDAALLKQVKFDTAWRVRADYEHFLRLKYRHHAFPVYLRMTIADYEGGGFSETAENERLSETERARIIAMYLPEEKIRRYDLYRTLTFSRFRTALSRNPKTAGAYQKIKRFLYRGGKDA